MTRKLGAMIRVISILIWYLGGTWALEMEKKAEVGGSGRGGGGEGNTSFVEGTSWCIAHPGAAQIDVQNALDWACGVLDKADCNPIRPPSGQCFHPNTLLAHASFAFNTYYQQNGNSRIACNFGGTAFITKNDPSYDRCIYDSSASGLLKSSASRPSSPKLSKLGCLTLASVSVLFFHRI